MTVVTGLMRPTALTALGMFVTDDAFQLEESVMVIPIVKMEATKKTVPPPLPRHVLGLLAPTLVAVFLPAMSVMVIMTVGMVLMNDGSQDSLGSNVTTTLRNVLVTTECAMEPMIVATDPMRLKWLALVRRENYVVNNEKALMFLDLVSPQSTGVMMTEFGIAQMVPMRLIAQLP